MDTTLGEAEEAVGDLARDLLSRRVTPDRVEKVESSDDRFDRDLWVTLAEAGLLGVEVPEEVGGLGLGAVARALVLEQLGAVVAPVPLAPTLTAAAVLAAVGGPDRQAWLRRIAAGDAVVAVAPAVSTGTVRADGDALTGTAVAVPWAHVADRVLLAAGPDIYLLDPAGAGIRATRGDTTARQLAVTLDLDSAPAERVGDGAAALLTCHDRLSHAAVQAGVTAAAVRLTAAYTSEREQFGKPLSTFQGVALKAADAFLDATVIRATVLKAAWSLDEPDVDASLPVLSAAWWAAEAGQHCVHLTQHLHGGMGADITYPVHRYFLWGKQIELLVGGASALLAEIGDALHERPDAGDALHV